ncbi:hypothetical protein MLD38_035157 [Melastoma candidum]|uniref:Uncharacterized protein n=1 Tax=Melastoma candidum TaxID=119954 RepID=A0ACB9MBY7_9MYRT|nr:hypothetical protein MLD38_035157 [Melastoma candidum]
MLTSNATMVQVLTARGPSRENLSQVAVMSMLENSSLLIPVCPAKAALTSHHGIDRGHRVESFFSRIEGKMKGKNTCQRVSLHPNFGLFVGNGGFTNSLYSV